MASIRRLKKDIDYLTFAVIDDSLNCLSYGKDSDNIGNIVQEVIDARNGMRRRINALRSLPKNERKAHCRAICKDLMVAVDGAFSKLSEMVKGA